MFLASKSGGAQARSLIRCLRLAVALWVLPFVGLHAAAQSNAPVQGVNWLNEEPQFLPVDDAFQLRVSMQPNRVILARWEMASGYYLYRHQFDVRLNALDSGAMLGEPRIPEGIAKRDEFFGDVEVYYDSIAIQVPVVGALPDGAELHVDYQGCADAGLCYPPETRSFSVSGGALLPKAAAGKGETLREQVKNLTPPARLCSKVLVKIGLWPTYFKPAALPFPWRCSLLQVSAWHLLPAFFRWCRFCQPLSSAKARV